ncbi:hypothetical protein [Cyclobacterium roseum]|uniref:hypothetical protein n=1 Tax=Cyclobacterium roseum TaxID=2666137 RepID=UPI00139123A2|nr:hypothetical protein [Cyclobacterium roseum]
MRKESFIPFLAFLILTISCNNNDEPTAQGIRNVTSQLCNNISGVEGLYWDISNGVNRGDIPGGVPTVAQLGGNFIHSGHPLLGFTYPSGYSPVELRQDNPLLIGVNLLRNDDQAVWRYYLQTVNSATNATQVLQSEINQFLNFVGGNGQNLEVACSNNASGSQASTGMQQTFASRMIRSQGFTGVFVVDVKVFPDLGFSFIATQVSFSPTADFENEILTTYLPVSWQLLFTDSGSSPDRDGDGVPDDLDRAPDDPTRW